MRSWPVLSNLSCRTEGYVRKVIQNKKNVDRDLKPKTFGMRTSRELLP